MSETDSIPEVPPVSAKESARRDSYEASHYPEPPRPGASRPFERSPFIAGMLSFVLPGLGNVYNGLMQRGLLNFAIAICLFFSAAGSKGGPELALIVPSLIFVWLFGIVDAVRQATLINYGVTEADLPPTKVAGPSSGGSVAVGVALFLIGIVGLLEAFDIDLFSQIVDYWYLLPMAFGAWLIFHGMKSAKAPGEASEDEI